MMDVILKRALEEYVSNFKVMLSFGVMFVFLPLFVILGSFFFSSGSVFLPFNANLLAAVGLVLVLIFLYFFSFFVSLTVYAVHRDLQTLSLDAYWNTLFKDAALKIFFLYLVFSIIFFAISSIGFMFNLVFFTTIINMLLALVIMFAPQSIVIDEASIGESIRKSIEFWTENFVLSLTIFILTTVLLFLIIGLELLLNLIGLPGVIVSFFLVLVVLVPFMEQTKSYAYLMKNALLQSNEVSHARAPHIEKPKPHYGVRLREQPRRGSKI